MVGSLGRMQHSGGWAIWPIEMGRFVQRGETDGSRLTVCGTVARMTCTAGHRNVCETPGWRARVLRFSALPSARVTDVHCSNLFTCQFLLARPVTRGAAGSPRPRMYHWTARQLIGLPLPLQIFGEGADRGLRGRSVMWSHTMLHGVLPAKMIVQKNSPGHVSMPQTGVAYATGAINK